MNAVVSTQEKRDAAPLVIMLVDRVRVLLLLDTGADAAIIGYHCDLELKQGIVSFHQTHVVCLGQRHIPVAGGSSTFVAFSSSRLQVRFLVVDVVIDHPIFNLFQSHAHQGLPVLASRKRNYLTEKDAHVPQMLSVAVFDNANRDGYSVR